MEREPRARDVVFRALREAPPQRKRAIALALVLWTRVLVRAGAAHRVVLVRDISRFIADNGLVSAITASGQHLTDYTLNDLETRLAGLFVRANRAELIQIDRVDRVASNGDGSAAITLRSRDTRVRGAAVAAAAVAAFFPGWIVLFDHVRMLHERNAPEWRGGPALNTSRAPRVSEAEHRFCGRPCNERLALVFHEAGGCRCVRRC